MSLISFPNIVAKEARDCQQTPRGHDAPSSADEAVRRPIPLLDSTWWRWSKTRKIEHHLPFSRAVDPFGDEGGIVGTGKGLEDRPSASRPAWPDQGDDRCGSFAHVCNGDAPPRSSRESPPPTPAAQSPSRTRGDSPSDSRAALHQVGEGVRRETRDVSGDQETKRRETGFTSHVSRLTPHQTDARVRPATSPSSRG